MPRSVNLSVMQVTTVPNSWHQQAALVAVKNNENEAID